MTTLSHAHSAYSGHGPVRQPLVRATDQIDQRWAQNYACSVLDTSAELLGEHPTCVHPGYLSYPQWLARQQIREHPLFRDATRIIHLDERCALAEPLRVGQTLEVHAGILDVKEAKTGADVTVLFEYFDAADGRLIGSTSSKSRYWGISAKSARAALLDADAHATPPPDMAAPGTSPDPAPATRPMSAELYFPPYACHVYSELSRIWTPFHTDLAAARETGFDGLILHGTGVLSWVLSVVSPALPTSGMDAVRRFSAQYRSPLFIDRSYLLAWEAREADGLVVVDYSLAGQDELVVARGQLAATLRGDRDDAQVSAPEHYIREDGEGDVS